MASVVSSTAATAAVAAVVVDDMSNRAFMQYELVFYWKYIHILKNIKFTWSDLFSQLIYFPHFQLCILELILNFDRNLYF